MKSSLISNLNHSNRIINDQVMVQIPTLVKIEYQWQNTIGTGTSLIGTDTAPRNLPRMWVFLLFFHILLPKSTQYFIYTSKPLQIHLVIFFLLKSSFITYLSSKLFMNYSQNHSNMGHNPYTTQTQGLVRVCSKP